MVWIMRNVCNRRAPLLCSSNESACNHPDWIGREAHQANSTHPLSLGGTLNSRVRWLALLLVWIGLVGGCERAPQAAPAPSPASTPDTAPAAVENNASSAAKAPQRQPGPYLPPREIAKVSVVELYETHRDTFPERALGPATFDSAVMDGPLISFNDSGLFVDPDLAKANDPGALLAAGLVLADDVSGIGQIRFVVVHRTQYAGTGRMGNTCRFLGFANLPATIRLPDRFPATDRWEVDIANDGSLKLAARFVTVWLPGAQTLQIANGQIAGGLAITYQDKVNALTRDQPLEIIDSSRTVTINEKPVVADFVGPGGDEQGVVVLPTREHGPITFSTRLAVVFRGERSIWAVSPDDATAVASAVVAGTKERENQ